MAEWSKALDLGSNLRAQVRILPMLLLHVPSLGTVLDSLLYHDHLLFVMESLFLKIKSMASAYFQY